MTSHCFDVHIATEYKSTDVAILLWHFQYWIMKNKRLNRNNFEGRTWTYQTIEEITSAFPYWSKKQIERLLNKVTELKILLKGNFNKTKFDRTVWYAFDNEEKFGISRFREMDFTDSGNGFDEIGTPIPDTIPNTITNKGEEEAAPPTPPLSNKKEKKKAEEKPKSKYRDNVTLTEEEHEKLVAQYGEEKLKWMLDFLDAKKGATGNKYKYTSDYHVLLPSNWVNEAYEKHRKEGKVIPISVDQSKNDHASKNKQLCERVEDKLRNYFTPNIFFTAEPAAAFLKYGPKDYEKRYFYADHNYEKFKEEIQKDLKTFFPRAFPENGMTAQKIVERASNA